MSADAPVFTLRYDTELDDLAELAHLDDRRKRLRMRAAIGLPCILLITGLLTGLTVALNRPSVSAQGAPGWLYVVDTLGWLYVLWHLRMLWRLSPAVIARRVWRTRPGIRGAHQEEISDAGIVATAPGQPRVFPLVLAGRHRGDQPGFPHRRRAGPPGDPAQTRPAGRRPDPGIA